MNFKSLQLGQAFRLVTHTVPILMVRLGANLLFWLVALLYLGITGGIAWLVAQAIPVVGVILFIVALVGVAPLYRLAQRYVLYMIKAAQLAVISELLVRGNLPPGTSQLAWGKQRVQERFGQANVMFVVDELVSAVVRGFTNTVYRVASWLPGDAFENLARILNRVVRFALSYVDEAILARTFWLDSGTVWANAREGVVLYGMVWKPLLANAIALMVLSYIPFVLALVLFALPVGALAALISARLAGWSIIAVLILAWLVKVAVVDSFAMAAMVAAYKRETAQLEPDPAVASQLDRVSNKFGELARRAETELAGLRQQPQDAAPVAVDSQPV